MTTTPPTTPPAQHVAKPNVAMSPRLGASLLDSPPPPPVPVVASPGSVKPDNNHEPQVFNNTAYEFRSEEETNPEGVAEVVPGEWPVDPTPVLQRWKTQAFLHMHLQKSSSAFFRTTYNWLTIPVLVLSTVSSALLVSPLDTSSPGVRVVATLATVLSACMVALQRQVQPVEQAARYASTARKYAAIIQRIDGFLQTGRQPDASRVEKFIDTLHTDLVRTIDTQSDPPSWVLSRFEKRYGARADAVIYEQDITSIVANNIRTKGIQKSLDRFAGFNAVPSHPSRTPQQRRLPDNKCSTLWKAMKPVAPPTNVAFTEEMV